MANRIETATVTGENVKLSSKKAGTAGSFNAVTYAFTFDSAWDGTTKKITFFNRNTANPVTIDLTTNLLVDGKYMVPIPAEPLEFSGEFPVTVRGVELEADGVTAKRIIISAHTVMESGDTDIPTSDVAPVEPTPTQAEQLQAEIDEIIDDIGGAAQAVIDANAAKVAAQTAQANAETAETHAELAETNAETAQGLAEGAKDDAITAKNAAQTAQGLSESARDSAITAKNDAVTAKNAAQSAQSAAETAKSGADTAKTGADTAKSGAETAKTGAESARDTAVSAKNAAEAAQTAAELAETHAETAETNAETAEGNAEDFALDSEAYGVGTRNGVDVGSSDPAYHNNSLYYKNQAEAIVGTDYMLKTTYDPTAKNADAFSMANMVEGTTNKILTATERTKLSGIATGATANSSDTTLLNRANHTGTQLKSTISDFPTEMTPTSHTHGNITNDGKIGSTADLPIFTSTAGALVAKTVADAKTLLGINDKAQIETFSYTGAGTYFDTDPNSVTLSIAPKLVWIYMYKTISSGLCANVGVTGAISPVVNMEILTTNYAVKMPPYGGALNDAYAKKSADGKTLTWYSNSSAANQFNDSAYVYYGVAIGLGG